MKQQHWTATSADAPSHQHSSKHCLADTLGDSQKARLRSEKLMCVCTCSPFRPALRGGVCLTKHACQLSLACFVNTQRWLGSRARSPFTSVTWRYVKHDWLKGNYCSLRYSHSYCQSFLELQYLSAFALTNIIIYNLLQTQWQEMWQIS